VGGGGLAGRFGGAGGGAVRGGRGMTCCRNGRSFLTAEHDAPRRHLAAELRRMADERSRRSRRPAAAAGWLLFMRHAATPEPCHLRSPLLLMRAVGLRSQPKRSCCL